MVENNIIQDETAKKAEGYAAADLVENGMTIGLGTGSTAKYFIEKLVLRHKEGLEVQAVSTSLRSEKLAKDGGIPIIDINTLTSLDMVVDGADEIDDAKQMIKGGGGALLREKIVATMSKEMIIVVDEKKLVSKLGKFPLPVEILPFGYLSIVHQINQLGYKGSLRKNEKNEFYVTDNQNYIYDIRFSSIILDPENLHNELKRIVGVIETGLFLHLASRIVIGYKDGSVEIRS